MKQFFIIYFIRYLAGNPQLKARIVKFGSKSGNHKVSDCVLTDVNVACYQKDTCINDAGYLKKYRQCTNYEVDDTKFNVNTYSMLRKLYKIV